MLLRENRDCCNENYMMNEENNQLGRRIDCEEKEEMLQISENKVTKAIAKKSKTYLED